MVQSFIVYGLLGFVLWGLGTISAERERFYQQNNEKISFWTWDILLALFIFAFISGIRWQVGVDHLRYLESYTSLKQGLEYQNEIGFVFIANIFASLDLHFTLYFAFWAFIQISFIYYAVKEERYLLPFIGIIIIGGPHYLSWMNGIRQMVAACMFVYSIKFIRERKLIPYLVTILLAATIHRSAILLVFLYFIPQLDYFKSRYLNLVLLAVTLFIGMAPTWLQTVEFVEQLLMVIGYEVYSENLNRYVEQGESLGLGPRRISILLLTAINIWYAPKLKKVFKETNYLIYFNFMFVGALLYNLFVNAHHVFLRPANYFTIFIILTTSYLLYYLKPDKRFYITARFAIVFLLVISYMCISIVAAYLGGGVDYTNFKFFWNY